MKALKSISLLGAITLMIALSSGCLFGGSPRQEGLYFAESMVDFGQVKAGDTGFNGASIINNTTDSFIVLKPKLTQNKVFWIIRNFSANVDTIRTGNYDNVPSLGFIASSPGVYRDTLVILSYPDTTHLLLSEPIVATAF